MTSISDASSASFSMHSHVLTRASTRTENTELLDTPVDDISIDKPIKQAVLGPRTMDVGYGRPAIGIHTGSYGSVQYQSFGGLVNGAHGAPEYGPGSYFPLSHDPGTGINRQRSTKQLISRYESMSAAPSALPVRHPPTASGAATAVNEANHSVPSVLSPKKSKRRSISNSLRNLMSVFKKGKGAGKDKESEDDPFARYRNSVSQESVDATNKPPSVSHEASLASSRSVVKVSASTEIPQSVHESNSLYSGTLLYLARPPSSDHSILPVWTTSTVTLYVTHFLITRSTPQGNPSTHILPLTACTDVRSLALHQISEDERALLPDQEDLRIFEVLFDGRPKEKFAASSVHSRAGWVTAIWDAILKYETEQNDKDESHQATGSIGKLRINTDLPPLPLLPASTPAISHYATSEYTSTSAVERESTLSSDPAPSSYSAERSLPPTPVATTPLTTVPFPPRITLYDPPVQHHGFLSPTTPSDAASRLSPVSSRPKSPSIAKLGNLSVVRQRLAEIERTCSIESSESASLYPSPTLQRASTTRSARVRNAFSEIDRLQKEGDFFSGSESGSPALRAAQPTPALHMNSQLSPPAETGLQRKQPTVKYRNLGKVSHLPTLPSVVHEDALELATGISHKVDDDSTLAPLAELIQDSAARSYDQAAGIGEQIIALREEVSRLPNALEAAVTGPISLSKAPKVQEILSKLEKIEKQTYPENGKLQGNSIMKTLEAMQMQLKSDIPQVLARLDAIRNVKPQGDGSHSPITARNLHPPSSPFLRSPTTKTSTSLSSVDVSDIYAKLDELSSLYKVLSPALGSAIDVGGNDLVAHNGQGKATLNAKLQEIFDHLKSDEVQRKLQSEQQADSVRYLNELNSWLDAFVNNGTSQIQTIANSVEHLCKQFGCTVGGDGENDGLGEGLITDLRQLIASHNDRRETTEDLQNSINDLIGTVRTHLNSGLEERSTMVTESIMSLIARQRQDQENMLRALSSELTNEIRGERLRFVEAMKEATAINVQAHVEQFKEELTREVMTMTQEVGNLHKEKQTVEQQIADLFAFYAKQKQDAEMNTRRTLTSARNLPPLQTHRVMNNLQNVPPNTPTHRRPLPTPTQTPTKQSGGRRR